MVERPIGTEQRTQTFFEHDPFTLSEKLTQGGGMVIGVPNSDKKILVVKAQAYSKRDVGKRYGAMNEMHPGDLFSPLARGGIAQSLIVAKDEDGVGACVRLLQAKYFDPEAENFVPRLKIGNEEFKPNEGDITRYLGFPKRYVGSLRFIDNTDNLYLFL